MEPVTIAIPFYRGLDYLRAAIQSVRAQDSDRWKLLVVDDSADELEPPDAVRDLVASYADERMRSARNPRNLGMVPTWNRCIDSADTDLVTLLHGDDRLLPGYVGLMSKLAERHPGAAAFYCGAEIMDADGREVFSFQDAIKRFFVPKCAVGEDEVVLAGDASTTALMKGNFIMAPTLCFRRSVLGDRRFATGWRQAQDLELTSRLLMDGEALVGAREVAYAYRRHAESATALQSESGLRFEEEFRLFDRVAERARQLGWIETADVAERKRIIRLHLLYRAVRDLLALRIASATSTLRLLRRGPLQPGASGTVGAEAVASPGVAQVLRLVLREIDWRALRFARGVCPLCGGHGFVRISHDLLGTRCLSCKASPISMAIGTVLLARVPRFADLRVCELSSQGPFVAFLSRQVAAGTGALACSEYFDGVEPGSVVDGVPCEDVQQLTYPDASFDVCTSTEVFEHVPDDQKGFAELFRVLVPGGRLLLTVPLADEDVTVERAVLSADGEVRHVLPATYHDDRIRGSARVLVFRDYGRDITERLGVAGFIEAEIALVPDPSGGSAVARVVTARKP